jgi:hypothetical protein
MWLDGLIKYKDEKNQSPSEIKIKNLSNIKNHNDGELCFIKDKTTFILAAHTICEFTVKLLEAQESLPMGLK